jgi:hypothetical protein
VMVWWWTEAVLQAVRLRSVGPVAGYLLGIVDGIQTPLRAALPGRT